MKSNSSGSRLHWPRAGVAVRVPPRRLAGAGATCELIPFAGAQAQATRRHPWDDLASGIPRGAAVVLLVAAEDVSFTAADVPSLTGMRLREALPNLVEEKTVGEVGSLHVALGLPDDEGRGRTLGVIDRVWLATMQVHVVRSGHRVASIVPESLAIPFINDAWSLGCVPGAAGEVMRCWLRTDTQQAMLLPDDADSAVAIAAALMRQRGGDALRPKQLALYASSAVATEAVAFGESLAASLALTLVTPSGGGDPFTAWLAGGGQEGGYGAPLSLLSIEGSSGGDAWKRWRIAAALVVAIVAVQVIGMQWEWGRLRGEASALKQRVNATLTSTFPATTVISDASIQMSQGLAGLRASAGHSDPADFSTMIAASARIFATLPSNALRSAEYEARSLKLRFAPGTATAGDERDRLVVQATQEGYVLRFDAAANAAGEASASLKTKGGA